MFAICDRADGGEAVRQHHADILLGFVADAADPAADEDGFQHQHEERRVLKPVRVVELLEIAAERMVLGHPRELAVEGAFAAFGDQLGIGGQLGEDDADFVRGGVARDRFSDGHARLVREFVRPGELEFAVIA